MENIYKLYKNNLKILTWNMLWNSKNNLDNIKYLINISISLEPDIIALQEVPKEFIDNLILNKYNYVHNYQKPEHMVTFYKKNFKLKNYVNLDFLVSQYNKDIDYLNNADLKKYSGRPCQILEFDNFYFINVHLPQLKNNIEKYNNNNYLLVKDTIEKFLLYDKNIIISGDFNQKFKSFTINKKSIFNAKYDNLRNIDHILTNLSISYGLQLEQNYSDHKPVIALIKYLIYY
jgi:endonuclease/exonuclease/phosphatase family metal-dependent hydrolase